MVAEQPQPGDLGVGASAVPLLAIPVNIRSTTDGDTCQLPVVYQGEILDDCIFRSDIVSWACLTAGGTWKQCDLSSSPPPVDDTGVLQVGVSSDLPGLAWPSL